MEERVPIVPIPKDRDEAGSSEFRITIQHEEVPSPLIADEVDLAKLAQGVAARLDAVLDVRQADGASEDASAAPTASRTRDLDLQLRVARERMARKQAATAARPRSRRPPAWRRERVRRLLARVLVGVVLVSLSALAAVLLV